MHVHVCVSEKENKTPCKWCIWIFYALFCLSEIFHNLKFFNLVRNILHFLTIITSFLILFPGDLMLILLFLFTTLLGDTGSATPYLMYPSSIGLYLFIPSFIQQILLSIFYQELSWAKTDTEAKAPILWPPDAKSWLIGKDPNAEKDWGQEDKRTKEDEMVGWHHWINGHEFEQTLGDGEGQGSLACLSSWGHKESDMT